MAMSRLVLAMKLANSLMLEVSLRGHGRGLGCRTVSIGDRLCLGKVTWRWGRKGAGSWLRLVIGVGPESATGSWEQRRLVSGISWSSAALAGLFRRIGQFGGKPTLVGDFG
jgi:hypothetical protein